MNTQNETAAPSPTQLTPVMRRLLNHRFLAQGRSGLVMSPRKRERLILREKERQEYLAEHPWFGQIEGWQREIIRRMVYGLQRIGRERDAARLHDMLFSVGDCLGKEVIWPLLSHLLEGGVFVFDGEEIGGNFPNTKNLPSVNLEEFLAAHAPPDTRPAQLLLVRLFLEASSAAEKLVRSALENLKEPTVELKFAEGKGQDEVPEDQGREEQAQCAPSQEGVSKPPHDKGAKS